MKGPGEHLSEILASRFLKEMDDGILEPGSRLPSLREATRITGTSQGTVLEAYRILEDRGAIEAVHGSGFFVKSNNHPTPPEPGKIRRSGQVRFNPVMDLAINLENRKLVAPFGLALPSEELMPVASIQKAILRASRLEAAHEYSFVPGCQALREELAGRLISMGIGTDPSRIFLTAGATGAAFAVLSEVTSPGDRIAVESPTYGGFLYLAGLLKLELLEIPTHSDTGLDLPALERSLEKEKIRMLITVPSYQNPTGALMPLENRRRLLGLARKHGFLILEDDIYGPIHHGGKREPTLYGLDPSVTFYTSSFSKIVSPAFRTGWLLVPSEFEERIQRRLRTSTLSGSRLMEEALAIFLKSGYFDRHMRQFRREVRSRVHKIREWIVEEFPPGTRVSSPSGGFLLWVELDHRVDTVVLQKEVIQKGITISPGVIFSAGSGYKNYIRMNCGVPINDGTRNAIRTLGRAIGKMLRQGESQTSR